MHCMLHAVKHAGAAHIHGRGQALFIISRNFSRVESSYDQRSEWSQHNSIVRGPADSTSPTPGPLLHILSNMSYIPKVITAVLINVPTQLVATNVSTVYRYNVPSKRPQLFTNQHGVNIPDETIPREKVRFRTNRHSKRLGLKVVVSSTLGLYKPPQLQTLTSRRKIILFARWPFCSAS